ncbi:MAG: GNAT family N-acetyltransferase, partial [Chloroflexota bacterium]
MEPLSEAHAPLLAHVGLDPAIWRYMLYGEIRSEADLLAWVRDILARQALGGDLAFTVFDCQTGLALG